MLRSLVGSEMCIRDRDNCVDGCYSSGSSFLYECVTPVCVCVCGFPFSSCYENKKENNTNNPFDTHDESNSSSSRVTATTYMQPPSPLHPLPIFPYISALIKT
eukprot:TRINITY_DN27806_c0_g1_i2.p1 TRINITY_DN27806_c0_g1~~TRINITY_DN27806_c0_g1_i2.p1  ORF type:complete len:103 (+),score=8.47 TRINITY_DN27806_c0_g1_i2:107-415(+)